MYSRYILIYYDDWNFRWSFFNYSFMYFSRVFRFLELSFRYDLELLFDRVLLMLFLDYDRREVMFRIDLGWGY